MSSKSLHQFAFLQVLRRLDHIDKQGVVRDLPFPKSLGCFSLHIRRCFAMCESCGRVGGIRRGTARRRAVCEAREPMAARRRSHAGNGHAPPMCMGWWWHAPRKCLDSEPLLRSNTLDGGASNIWSRRSFHGLLLDRSPK